MGSICHKDSELTLASVILDSSPGVQTIGSNIQTMALIIHPDHSPNHPSHSPNYPCLGPIHVIASIIQTIAPIIQTIAPIIQTIAPIIPAIASVIQTPELLSTQVVSAIFDQRHSSLYRQKESRCMRGGHWLLWPLTPCWY